MRLNLMIIALILTLSISAMAASSTYLCKDADGTVKQLGQTFPATARLTLTIDESENAELTILANGGIGIDYSEIETKEFKHQGIFQDVVIEKNLELKPINNNYLFKSLNATQSTEGMEGDLMISDTMDPSNGKPAGAAPASYLFQAGEYKDGVLDLDCLRITKKKL